MADAFRNGVKRAVKRAALVLGAALPAPRPPSRILTYHSVGNLDHAMNVTPTNFTEQMAWLADNAPLISLDDAAQAQPGIAVTLDDGYRDNLTNAAPVLVQHGIPAVVFVVAGKMGATLTPESDPANGRLMTWDEARELLAMGIAIGGHSMTHPRLSQLTPERQRLEIIGSCKRILGELGQRPRYFAYPYGTSADYNDVSVQLAQEAGCDVACSNRYGYNVEGCDRYTLRRIWIDATDSMQTFRAKVTGRLDVLSVLDSRAGMFARRKLNSL